MKIAVLADVHANDEALQAVVEHARANEAAAFWFAGDFLGYGPAPSQVVRRLRALTSASIVGNYDQKVLELDRYRSKWAGKKNQLKILAFEWAEKHLNQPTRRYLKRLPEQQRLEVEGWQVLIVHGSPVSIKEHLGPETPTEHLAALALLAKAQLVVCGHSHQPFVRRVGETIFLNPGSVGRPDDGDPRAAYALLDLQTGQLAVKLLRVPYDLAATVRAIRRAGLPDEFGQMVWLGRDLDTVQQLNQPQVSESFVDRSLEKPDGTDHPLARTPASLSGGVGSGENL